MDTKKAIAVMQDEHSAWEYGNFGTQLPWVPLAGIAEEAGELSHAYLKLSQGIRGDAAKHKADACDAVGDILVYLVSYCTKMGFRFAQIITHGDMLGVDDPKSNWLQRDGLFYINRCIARLVEAHVEAMDEEIVKSRVYDVVVSLSIFSANFLGGSKALTHLLTAWDAAEGSGKHAGVDLKLPRGTPIGAIAGGRVSYIGTSHDLGLFVMVEHRLKSGETFYSIYAHFDRATVTVGQDIEPGEQLGNVGMTGNTSGPHLHLQVDRGEPGGNHTPFQEGGDAATGMVNPITFISMYRNGER
jgi:NTP pyrophosphatase (non-canonical NTP hydrolase)